MQISLPFSQSRRVHFSHFLGKISLNVWISGSSSCKALFRGGAVKLSDFVLLELIDGKGDFASVWRSNPYSHASSPYPPLPQEVESDVIKVHIVSSLPSWIRGLSLIPLPGSSIGWNRYYLRQYTVRCTFRDFLRYRSSNLSRSPSL